MKLDLPEDVYTESQYLKAIGYFHFVILQVLEGKSDRGTDVNGFSLVSQVLAGEDPSGVDKNHSEVVFYPDMTKSDDKIEQANRRIAAALIATNLATPEMLGKKGVEFDLQKMVGQQYVAKIVKKMNRDDKTGKYTVDTNFVQVSYNDFFHVDDPRVANVPKLEDALKMPTVVRRDAAFFTPILPKKGASAAAAAPKKESFDEI